MIDFRTGDEATEDTAAPTGCFVLTGRRRIGPTTICTLAAEQTGATAHADEIAVLEDDEQRE